MKTIKNGYVRVLQITHTTSLWAEIFSLHRWRRQLKSGTAEPSFFVGFSFVHRKVLFENGNRRTSVLDHNAMSSQESQPVNIKQPRETIKMIMP